MGMWHEKMKMESDACIRMKILGREGTEHHGGDRDDAHHPRRPPRVRHEGHIRLGVHVGGDDRRVGEHEDEDRHRQDRPGSQLAGNGETGEIRRIRALIPPHVRAGDKDYEGGRGAHDDGVDEDAERLDEAG